MNIWGIVALIILSPFILIASFFSLAIIYGIIYTLVSSVIDYISKITNKE